MMQDKDDVKRVTKWIISKGDVALYQQEFSGASDSSFADDKATRCSSEGMIFHLFGTPVDWKAARQKTVTKSSTDAEWHQMGCLNAIHPGAKRCCAVVQQGHHLQGQGNAA